MRYLAACLLVFALQTINAQTAPVQFHTDGLPSIHCDGKTVTIETEKETKSFPITNWGFVDGRPFVETADFKCTIKTDIETVWKERAEIIGGL